MSVSSSILLWARRTWRQGRGIPWQVFGGLLAVTGLALNGADPDRAGPMAPGKNLWWSLAPLTRPVVPVLAEPNVATPNPVDAFIRAKLAEKQLAPSPEADRRTLIG